MKYKIGEYVRFVEEKREGYITSIIDDLTIAVTDTDGFEIPVLASQVTRIHGQPWEENENSVSDHDSAAEFIKSGIYLAFTTDNRTASVAHLHILNRSSYQLLATLNTEKNAKYTGEYSGIVQPQSWSKVYSLSLNELDRWPALHIQLLLQTRQNDELPQPIRFSRRFHGRDFSTTKEPVIIADEKAWLFRLDADPKVVDFSQLKKRFNAD